MGLNMRLGLSAITCCLYLPSQATAQQPKVEEQSGHLSPVMVKLTFMNDTSRTTMLVGVGDARGDSYITHALNVRTDGGASERRLWLDSIASIEGTSTMRTRSSEFTVLLKDGTKLAAQLTGQSCEGEIHPTSAQLDCRMLHTQNQDDGGQKIDLRNVKTVEFLGAARKDKTGKAMFETWLYSPFTGEKLPQ